jgi:predicted Zn-dependent protease
VKPPASKPGGPEAFRTAAGRWDHTNLTYHFVNFSPDLPVNDQKRMIERAFQQWAEVTPLTFTEVSTGADIDIMFRPAYHGDDDPFDGPSGVLAHAFFPPPNGGRIAGDLHFDEDEEWRDPFLHQVALHELGHSLGLRHSEVEDAVMWPWFAPKNDLRPDDIAGIQSKYGPRT